MAMAMGWRSLRQSCVGGVRHFFTKNEKAFSSRDVIVFDHRQSLRAWLQRNAVRGEYPLRHPVHAHVLSRYATCEYHRPFNYNFIGEFSLTIAAGESSSPSVCTDNNNNNNNNNNRSRSHDAVVWPDKLLLTGLSEDDASALYPFLLNENPIDGEALRKKLSASAKVQPLPNKLRVFVNVSENYPLFRAEQVLRWFSDSLDRIKAPMDRVELILGTGLNEHRKATQVLVLPFEDCFEGILSEQQVRIIVDRYAPMIHELNEKSQ